jgi:hypothetical protein
MGVALRRITMRYVDDPTYRQRIETYEVVDDSINGAQTTLMDVIEDALKFVKRPDHGAPLRAKTAAIHFVAFFLHPTTFVRRVAELIYDLDGPIHQELRNALNLYLSDDTQRDPEVPALGHSANLRAARRVRHHTFWNKPISDREVSPRTPLPVAPRAHTPAEGAVMSELTQKVWEAVGFMAAFSHDQNDIRDFFSLEEHARHAAEPMVELATAALSRVEELFRQTTAFPADGRRRWNSTNLFVYALRVFGELAKWRAQDNGAFGDVWGEVLDTWAEKVASVVRMAGAFARRGQPVFLVVRRSQVRDGRGGRPAQGARDRLRRPGGCHGGARRAEPLAPRCASRACATGGRGDAWTAPAAHRGVAVARPALGVQREGKAQKCPPCNCHRTRCSCVRSK